MLENEEGQTFSTSSLPHSSVAEEPTYMHLPRAVNLPPVNIPYQEKELAAEPTLKEVALTTAAMAGIAAVGYGIFKLGKWLFSTPAADQSAYATKDDQTQPNTAEWVKLRENDVLAMSIYIESDECDLWTVYSKYRDDFAKVVRVAVSDYVGPELESLVIIQKGSLWVKIVLRFKSSWDSLGRYVNSGVKVAQLNVTDIGRRIRSAISDFAAKVVGIAKAPGTKAIAKTTYRVFKGAASLAGLVLPILSFFGIHGASELGDLLRQWGSGSV